jgi:glycosyltransferase involved in cell wall biosynthesis
MEKIALIDPVGAKAGMDYYDLGLSYGLKDNSVEVFLFSNFQDSKSLIKTYPVFGKFYSNKFFQAINFFSAMFRACFICKSQNIKTVVLHLFSTQLMSFLSFLICKLFGLKIVVISHDVSSFASDDNSLFKNLIYKKWSSKIVVHNQFSFDALSKSVDSIRDKISIIQHGSFVDMPNDKITKPIALKALNLDSNYKYILFFGQIKKVKRLDLLLKAMAEVNSSIKLIVAGKLWKDNFDVYQQIMDDYKLTDKVILDIQFISDQKRELYFKCADLMVLPYQEIYQSGVLLMAMSYGVPSLVSDISPFKEIISDQSNGFLFESNNLTDLSQKINSIISDDNTLELVANQSVETMKNKHNWVKIAKCYLELF